jgi:HD superfamily phosphodiesterase
MKIMTTPTALAFLRLINSCFKYSKDTSEFYKIDESHALKHSMEVFRFAKNIYDSEVNTNKFLETQQDIIYASIIGHDMCDSKYMDVDEGVLRYKEFLSDKMSIKDIDVVEKIITTMSYSKVKVKGFPELGEYQLAYHIVREADLLAAYDIDRSIMYTMYRDNFDYTKALSLALDLFDYRVFKMRSDRLFKTKYSKKLSLSLHKKALKDVASLKELAN